MSTTGTGLQDVAAAIAAYKATGMKGTLPTIALAGDFSYAAK